MRLKRSLRFGAALAIASAIVTAAASAAPPEITITQKPADPSKSSAAQFEFTSSEPISAFKCSLDREPAASCATPKHYDNLVDGPHTFTVTGTNSTGETGSASYGWTVDAITLTGPPSLTPGRNATFTFARAAQTAGTFKCALDSEPLAPCVSPKTYSGLAEGTHVFRIQTADASGEVGSDEYSWTIDATPPKATVVSGPLATTSARVARFEFAVDDASAQTQCAVDQAALAPCSTPYTTSELGDGSHTFVVQATDAAGNTARVTYAWTIASFVVTSVDTTPPEAADALDYFVAYRYAEVTWLAPTDGDFDHVRVFQVDTDGRRTVVYSGKQSRYVNRSFNNGVDHGYQIVAYDHAGNASAAATVRISASALLGTPRRGARVERAPALRWAAVAGAAFYNVQVFRNRRKIASTWPRRPRVQLAARWHYAKRKYSLTRGTYEWWVWPAFRRGKTVRYGSALGHSSFVKR